MQNMNLEHFYLAELKHVALIAMVKVFPWQPHRLLIHFVTRNTCFKYELKIFSFN